MVAAPICDLLETCLLDHWVEFPPLEGIGSGNPFRESAEVTHALPHRMCVPLFTWLASDYWQPGALLVFTGNLGQLFPKESVISVGVDNVQKGWVLYM